LSANQRSSFILFVFAEGGATTDSVPWCGIKAKVLAEHLHRDASMISRLHAAYVEKRDKRSESEFAALAQD
jgi:hypothetical protein